MADKTIAIYCFLDDFVKAVGHKTDAHCKLSDAEITTLFGRRIHAVTVEGYLLKSVFILIGVYN